MQQRSNAETWGELSRDFRQKSHSIMLLHMSRTRLDKGTFQHRVQLVMYPPSTLRSVQIVANVDIKYQS